MGPDRVRQDPWWVVGVAVVRAVLGLFLRLRFTGLENLPDSGAAILAANHVSVLDPVILALSTARRGRTIRFMAAAEFFDPGRRQPARRFIAWGLRRFRQIPVRRGMADWGALREIAAAIEQGRLAGIFPEGRMGHGPELQPGRKGLARVAMTARVPIVPVAIWGTQERWPLTHLRWGLPLRPTVRVAVGRPIEPAGDPRDRREVRALTDAVMAEIEALLVPLQVRAGLAPRPRAAVDPGPGTAVGPLSREGVDPQSRDGVDPTPPDGQERLDRSRPNARGRLVRMERSEDQGA